MTRQQRLVVLIGLTISALFLAIAFNGLDPGATLGYLRAANPLLIALAAVWYFAAVLMIALRWRFLLRPAWRANADGSANAARPVSVPHLATLVSVGYMGNNVFPLRAGEFMRIALLQRDSGVPVGRTATTVLVERMLDGIVMLTFILVALVFGGFTIADDARRIALLVAPPFVVGLALFFYFALHPAKLQTLISRVIARMPERVRAPLTHLSDDAIKGLEALRTPTDLIGTVVCSYASWMLEASTYWLVAQAFGLGVDYLGMLLVVGVVNLAGLIPASPGQFGVYEFFVRAVLVAIGISDSLAVAYAFSIHMVIWLPVTLVGFIILWRRGLGWNTLRRARELEGTLTA
jgi:hypothetical protein